jgi:hypothetical protein
MPEQKDRTTRLAAKLAEITAQLERIAHDTDVAEGRGSSYRATSINAIADITRPLLAERGIVFLPIATTVLTHDEITSKGGARGFHVVIEQRWLITDGNDSIEASTTGASIDYSDKAYNKAHTFARKNLLVAMLNLSTGENPDAEQPEAGHGARSAVAYDESAPRAAQRSSGQSASGRGRQRDLGTTRWDVLSKSAQRKGIDDDAFKLALSEATGRPIEDFPDALDDNEINSIAISTLRSLVTSADNKGETE